MFNFNNNKNNTMNNENQEDNDGYGDLFASKNSIYNIFEKSKSMNNNNNKK